MRLRQERSNNTNYTFRASKYIKLIRLLNFIKIIRLAKVLETAKELKPVKRKLSKMKTRKIIKQTLDDPRKSRPSISNLKKYRKSTTYSQIASQTKHLQRETTATRKHEKFKFETKMKNTIANSKKLISFTNIRKKIDKCNTNHENKMNGSSIYDKIENSHNYLLDSYLNINRSVGCSLFGNTQFEIIKQSDKDSTLSNISSFIHRVKTQYFGDKVMDKKNAALSDDEKFENPIKKEMNAFLAKNEINMDDLIIDQSIIVIKESRIRRRRGSQSQLLLGIVEHEINKKSIPGKEFLNLGKKEFKTHHHMAKKYNPLNLTSTEKDILFDSEKNKTFTKNNKTNISFNNFLNKNFDNSLHKTAYGDKNIFQSVFKNTSSSNNMNSIIFNKQKSIKDLKLLSDNEGRNNTEFIWNEAPTFKENKSESDSVWDRNCSDSKSSKIVLKKESQYKKSDSNQDDSKKKILNNDLKRMQTIKKENLENVIENSEGKNIINFITNEEEDEEKMSLEEILSMKMTQKLVLLIMVLLMILPIFDIDYINAFIYLPSELPTIQKYCLNLINKSTLKSIENPIYLDNLSRYFIWCVNLSEDGLEISPEHPSPYFYYFNFSQYDAFNNLTQKYSAKEQFINIIPNVTYAHKDYEDMKINKRAGSNYFKGSFLVNENNSAISFVYNNNTQLFLDSFLNIIKVLFIAAILLIGSYIFGSDINTLVTIPIDKAIFRLQIMLSNTDSWGEDIDLENLDGLDIKSAYKKALLLIDLKEKNSRKKKGKLETTKIDNNIKVLINLVSISVGKPSKFYNNKILVLNLITINEFQKSIRINSQKQGIKFNAAFLSMNISNTDEFICKYKERALRIINNVYISFHQFGVKYLAEIYKGKDTLIWKENKEIIKEKFLNYVCSLGKVYFITFS